MLPSRLIVDRLVSRVGRIHRVRAHPTRSHNLGHPRSTSRPRTDTTTASAQPPPLHPHPRPLRQHRPCSTHPCFKILLTRLRRRRSGSVLLTADPVDVQLSRHHGHPPSRPRPHGSHHIRQTRCPSHRVDRRAVPMVTSQGCRLSRWTPRVLLRTLSCKASSTAVVSTTVNQEAALSAPCPLLRYPPRPILPESTARTTISSPSYGLGESQSTSLPVVQSSNVLIFFVVSFGPDNWPPYLPPPARLEHLVNSFFACSPLANQLFNKSRFLSRLSLQPNNPGFPHPVRTSRTRHAQLGLVLTVVRSVSSVGPPARHLCCLRPLCGRHRPHPTRSRMSLPAPTNFHPFEERASSP